jgi:hypothetical protein
MLMRRLCLLVLATALLASPVLSWGASESITVGSPIHFTDSGGTVTWDVTGLANGAGRISARHDLTATHTPHYHLECTFQGASTMTVGATVEIYLAKSNGGNPDGEIGTADAALTTDKRLNLDLAMTLMVDQTATDTNMSASVDVEILTQYVSVGAWNASGVTTEAGAGTSMCKLYPITRTIQ